MKRFNRLFQEAERLAPPPDLWKRIEAKSALAPGASQELGSRKPGSRKPGSQELGSQELGSQELGSQKLGGGKSGGPESAAFWSAPALRAAAAVVLAVGVLGLGVMLQKRMGGSAAYADSAAQAGATAETDRESEIVDPELLGWHADLGELNDEVLDAEEAEEAEEML